MTAAELQRVRCALTSYWLSRSGPLDIRIVYDVNNVSHCDCGEVVGEGDAQRIRWHGAVEMPRDVDHAAGEAWQAWPRLLPGYVGMETSQEMRDGMDAHYDRVIGPDPVLSAEAR